MADYLDGYTEENLPEDLQTVSSIIGIEATKKLMRSLKGCSIYFPARVDFRYMQTYIINNYTGKNRRDIQKHLGIEKTTFYTILHSKTSRASFV